MARNACLQLWMRVDCFMDALFSHWFVECRALRLALSLSCSRILSVLFCVVPLLVVCVISLKMFLSRKSLTFMLFLVVFDSYRMDGSCKSFTIMFVIRLDYNYLCCSKNKSELCRVRCRKTIFFHMHAELRSVVLVSASLGKHRISIVTFYYRIWYVALIVIVVAVITEVQEHRSFERSKNIKVYIRMVYRGYWTRSAFDVDCVVHCLELLGSLQYLKFIMGAPCSTYGLGRENVRIEFVIFYPLHSFLHVNTVLYRISTAEMFFSSERLDTFSNLSQ